LAFSIRIKEQLCLFVVLFAEIEGLRARLQQAENGGLKRHNFTSYIKKY
jgi:hypothetical protein